MAVAILASWPSFAAKQRIATGTPDETAAFGELLVLAVKGDAALDVMKQSGASNVAGKVVIDATNPIAAEPRRTA